MNILISHCDLDGFGVNVIQSIYKNYLQFDEVLNKNYGFEETDEIKQLITPENSIVITDLSIPENVYIQWKEIVKSIIIIDHHESSKYLDNYENNIWSIEMSGTRLFWEYYVKPILAKNKVELSNKIEHFVRLVDCYDRWQDTSELWLDATRLNKVNQAFGYSFVSHMVNKLTKDWEWDYDETVSYKEVEQIENLLVSECERDIKIKQDNNGYKFCLLNIKDKSKVSMVCSRVLGDYPELDYCIAYYANRPSFSFRTRRTDLDLTSINGVFGHKAAAGGAYLPQDFYNIIADNYCVSWVKPGCRKSNNLIIEPITNQESHAS